jgi:23S rRNA pseudouridine1911/1915/1917 synthase
MVKRNFIVENYDDKLRLDIFLADHNDDLSRSFIKKKIESDKVKVNGKVEYKANYSVKEGDETELEFSRQDHADKLPEPKEIPLDIIYEDSSLVVINKPSGMVVHPSTGHWDDTLVNALLYKYREIRKVGDIKRAGLIHRLDKDTSGLILVAKTNQALRFYSKQFARREVKKVYLMVTKGRLSDEIRRKGKIEIETHIGRNPSNRQKFTNVDEGGKYAFTRFTYLGRKGDYKLLSAEIETGRTHQIRVHASSIGLPVLGDDIYGRNNKYKRLMLHAFEVGITLFASNDYREFKSSIPDEFRNLFPKISNLEKDAI